MVVVSRGRGHGPVGGRGRGCSMTKNPTGLEYLKLSSLNSLKAKNNIISIGQVFRERERGN